MIIRTAIWLLTFGILSCTPSADITGTWKKNGVTASSIRKIVVMTLNGSTEARETIENSVGMALSQRGSDVIQGINMFPPGAVAASEDEPTREKLLEKIQGSEADAILTIALLNEHTEERYVPGSDPYDPMPRFGYTPDFWGYYSDRHPVLNTPGYYQDEMVYFLEINLYDARKEELMWSAQSQTYSPGDLTSAARDFAGVLVDKMEKDGLIAPR